MLNEDKCWKKLWRNVNMSSESGAAGMRTASNPKLSGRERSGNQSTKRHKITISLNDIKKQYEKQNGLCYWLGIPMDLAELFVAHSPFAPSVDRLNSSLGYEQGNIVLATRFANKGRGCYDSPDFFEKLNKMLSERK